MIFSFSQLKKFEFKFQTILSYQHYYVNTTQQNDEGLSESVGFWSIFASALKVKHKKFPNWILTSVNFPPRAQKLLQHTETFIRNPNLVNMIPIIIK